MVRNRFKKQRTGIFTFVDRECPHRLLSLPPITDALRLSRSMTGLPPSRYSPGLDIWDRRIIENIIAGKRQVKVLPQAASAKQYELTLRLK
jgi:hypothetical protein